MLEKRKEKELDKYSLSLAVIAEYNKYLNNFDRSTGERELSLEMWCLLKTKTKI